MADTSRVLAGFGGLTSILLSVVPFIAAVYVQRDSTMGFTADNIELHGDATDCKLHNTYSAQLCVIASLSMIMGGILCFFGYRFFKFVLFLTGLLVGFFLTYMLCSMYLDDNLTGKAYEYRAQVYLGIAAGVGIVVGIFTVCLFYVGLFILGAAMGWFVGMAFLPLLVEHSTYMSENVWVPYLILCAFAVVGGILILCLQKIVIVIATSFLGAFCLVNGVDYFIENSVSLYYSINVLHGSVSKSMLPRCWYTWTLFTLIPVLFIAGMAVQYAKTSKGTDHRMGYDSQRPVLFISPEQTQLDDMANDQAPILLNYA